MHKLSISSVVILCFVSCAVYVLSLGTPPEADTARTWLEPAPVGASSPEMAGTPAHRSPRRLVEAPLASAPIVEPTGWPAAPREELRPRDVPGPSASSTVDQERLPSPQPLPSPASEPESAEVAKDAPVASVESFAGSTPSPRRPPSSGEASATGVVPVNGVAEPHAFTADDWAFLDQLNMTTTSGTRDLLQPMEADPTWVRSAEEARLTRHQLLSVSLPSGIAGRATEMLQHASRLADRGAYFAARQEFLRILRTTCQSLDAQIGKSVHSTALAAGLRALEEAEDFALTRNSPDADVHLKGFVDGHRTPVLRDADLSRLTALTAMQQYYKYAYQQLALAGNNEPIASDALYSLGRIADLIRQDEGTSSGGPKSLALYHAALTVYPRNAQAANELGVMLARRARLPEARQTLLQANQIAPTPTSLRNLAKVEEKLGNGSAAQRAQQQASQLEVTLRQQNGDVRGNVHWVDPDTFRNSGGPELAANAPALSRPSPTAVPQNPAPRVARQPEKKSRSSKFDSWNF